MSSVVTVNDFPDICNTIYEERISVANLSRRYIQELRETSCMANILYANKLEERSKMLQTQKLKELERDFYYFKEFMRRNCKIPFSIKYRLKDFIRYNDKIRYLLTKGEPLDRIRDLLGIRIILTSPPKDTLEIVQQCYQILDFVILFFVVQKHGLPLYLSGRSAADKNFNITEHPEIVIPEESLIPKVFRECVKDYIIHPKGEGAYQSLHIVIKMQNGVTVEFQIRTFAMDVSAEEGSSSHKVYTTNRREKTDIDLDYSKIQLPGFAYLPNGIICDTSGLTKSINPFNFF